MRAQHFRDLKQREHLAELGCHRRDAGIGNATRNDLLERRQVRIDVEGETVHCGAGCDPYADGGDLALRPGLVSGQPHTGPSCHPAAVQSEVGQSSDQRLLEPAHIINDVHSFRQAHDGIPDELAWTMPGDLATAVDVDYWGAVGWPLLGLSALAGGVDRRMFSRITVSGRV